MAKVDAANAQNALDMMQAAIGRRENGYSGAVTIRNADPLLASRHRFGEVMAAAQASLGMNLGEIWQRRGRSVQDVTTAAHAGVHQHHGIAFLRQNGRKLGFADYGAPGTFDDAVGSEFYATRDGKFIKFEMLCHASATPHTRSSNVLPRFAPSSRPSRNGMPMISNARCVTKAGPSVLFGPPRRGPVISRARGWLRSRWSSSRRSARATRSRS
ncbi:MAG: hypothetical protein LH624_12950 [Cryobacterium sp.]|nr:hypothetical protein [Cryobacterium sp.]